MLKRVQDAVKARALARSAQATAVAIGVHDVSVLGNASTSDDVLAIAQHSQAPVDAAAVDSHVDDVVSVAAHNYVHDVSTDNGNTPGPPDGEQHHLPIIEEREQNCLPADLALAETALRHGLSHSSLKDILLFLKQYGLANDMPLDPRTLLGTPRSVENIEKLNEKNTQQYYHFGLQYCLEVQLHSWPAGLPDGGVVKLQLNIDGLPVCNSTVASVHPILGHLLVGRDYKSDVFCIGIYFGNDKKPDDSHMVLNRFKEEYNAHRESGFTVHGKKVYVTITQVICDKVERDLIRHTKGHSGYATCEKCEVEGINVGHIVCVDVNAPLRNDNSFTLRRQPEHHTFDKRKGETVHTRSAFEHCGVGMVSQFPLDIMHLVFLGVVKRLMNIWMPTKKMNNKLQPMRAVSNDMCNNMSTCPSNFQRRPRRLEEFKHFKATEFRTFLLYLGPVLLQSRLDREGKQYKNFMLLAAAMRILLDDELRSLYVDTAEQFLKQFVVGMNCIYGAEQMPYNVHAVMHLAQEARLHGNLNEVNAFPFESHLGRMRKQLRRSAYTLPQMVKREREYQHVKQRIKAHEMLQPERNANAYTLKLMRKQERGPLPVGLTADDVIQYQACRLNNFQYSRCSNDCAVRVNERVGIIRNIMERKTTGEVLACVSFYREQKEFFNYPLNLSKVGIREVKNLKHRVTAVDLRDCRKVWLVSRSDGRKISVDLLHDCM